jgi:SAM-dependent methyltransferase
MKSDNPYEDISQVISMDLREMDHIKNKRGYTFISDSMIGQTTVKDPKIIYDWGCGSGFSTLALSRKFPEAMIYALDVSPLSIMALNYKLGRSNADLSGLVGENIISSEQATSLHKFWQSFEDVRSSKIIILERDLLQPFTDFRKADLIFSSQVIHWIYNQQKEAGLKQIMNNAIDLMNVGGEFVFSTFSTFCEPVGSGPQYMSHPLYIGFFSELLKELNNQGHDAEIRDKVPPMDADKYKKIINSSGLTLTDKRDISTRYSIETFISATYKSAPGVRGVFDGVEISNDEKKKLIELARKRAIANYSPDEKDSRVEFSIAPSFCCRKVR